MPVKLMGRYDVVKELVRGAHVVSYLAKDSRLGRQVVIKEIGPGSIAQNETVLREARAASNLHHPNIIPLYDLAAIEGMVYLVYAFVAGESVSQALARAGAMSMESSLTIVSDVLDALASAHKEGVMHLDITPSNVMISAGGQNLLMDLGIASNISKAINTSAGGTTQYMAPETLSAQGGEVRSDIYSVGMMLYEMLTGTAFAEGGKAEAVSNAKVKLDDKLAAIVQKAIAKKPEQRFATAQEMRQALLDYAESSQKSAAAPADADLASTLRFLLRRIRSKSDFPAMSGIINEINKIVSSEEDESSKLAQVILQDFSLTNKLLKLVNTVSYSQFGGQISTISKAVSILGFESVRNIAMSLILLDFLQNKSQAKEMKDVVVSSFFTGIVAVQLSEGKSAQEVEEAMICAMFLNLGRMLANFYFFEESEEITRLMESKGVDEDRASTEVLGVSYNELGIGIAKTWNFPASLIAGMRKIKGDKIIEPSDNIGAMSVTVNMANELCAIAKLTDAKVQEAALQKVQARYAKVADAAEENLTSALESGVHDLSRRSKVLGLDTSQSPMLKNLKTWMAHAAEIRKAAKAHAPQSAAQSIEGGASIDVDAENILNNAEEEEKEENLDPEVVLSNGIQDVTNTMMGEFKLNEVLQMVLETIYRGLGFRNVLIFSRDNKKNMMVGRFGFGEGVADILPSFHFPLAFEADVFHFSLEKGLDLVIDDVGAPNIASKIPAWHAKAIDSRYFLLLPVIVNNIPVGLIYADMLEARKLKIAPKVLSLLRTLRNQAVLAIKQKT